MIRPEWGEQMGSRSTWLALSLALMTASSACAQEDEHLEKVRRVLTSTPLAWGASENAAARIQGRRGPPNATIEELDGRPSAQD